MIAVKFLQNSVKYLQKFSKNYNIHKIYQNFSYILLTIFPNFSRSAHKIFEN